MGRRTDRVPVRLPSEQGYIRNKGALAQEQADQVILQLAVTKQGLGLELAKPLRLGPLRVEELSIALPQLRFPIDLSGGVARFRHRRGELTKLELALGYKELEAWCAARIHQQQASFLAPNEPLSLSITPFEGGWSVGLAANESALAWNILWAPLQNEVQLMVHGARGIGCAAPVHAIALQTTEAVLRPFATRQGSVFRIHHAVAGLLHELLPLAGVRFPAIHVGWGALRWDAHSWHAAAQAEPTPDRGAQAPLALELAELLVEADNALIAGDHARARGLYLNALERAPHHPELVHRLADLDRAQGDRAEAALATLVTATAAWDAGPLGASLLLSVGDVQGARAAFEQAAHQEPYAVLAALCLAAAADHVEHLAERAALLGAATARAPTWSGLRWKRLGLCLELGEERGAWAEAEHLEAIASGSDARHKTLRRLGEAFAQHGYPTQAVRLYERALRYAPQSEEALLGLGQGLAACSSPARAADVLARSIALGSRRGVIRHDATLALTRVLGEGLNDLPMAIARARSIAPGTREAAQARLLEGRFLARLGDRTAASLAFARMRDALEHACMDDPAQAARWLQEAADFECNERSDWEVAKRHLSVALRLHPRDQRLLAAFRRVAEAAEGARQDTATASNHTPVSVPPDRPRTDAESRPMDEAPSVGVSRPVATRPMDEAHGVGDAASGLQQTMGGSPLLDLGTEDPHTQRAFFPSIEMEMEEQPSQMGSPSFDDEEQRVEDEQRAEQLTAQLRATPNDLAVALELADVLSRLGRDMDLFALLSARLEEGDAATRDALLPKQRDVLTRLAQTARREGRASEAELYEMMLASLAS